MPAMLHPAYEISIGSKTLESPTTDNLISIRVSQDLDVPAASCEAFLRPADWTSKLKKDDPVRVSLGYDDSKVSVFSGIIDGLERTIMSVRVFALSHMLKLLNLRTNAIYTEQNAKDIVQDLAGKIGIAAGKIDSGIDLKTYYVDASKNAYEHIRELAERSGFDVYLNAESKLFFKKYEADKKHPLQYGHTILSVQAKHQTLAYKGVKILGESPASFKGSDTSTWLTTREVSGETGQDPKLQLFDPLVRDQSAAGTEAQAILKTLSYGKFLTVTVVGNSDIKLGDAIVLKQLPEDSLNGEYKVMGVEHLLSKSEGFRTTVECGGTVE